MELLLPATKESLLSCVATGTFSLVLCARNNADTARALSLRIRGQRILATKQDIDGALIEERLTQSESWYRIIEVVSR